MLVDTCGEHRLHSGENSSLQVAIMEGEREREPRAYIDVQHSRDSRDCPEEKATCVLAEEQQSWH